MYDREETKRRGYSGKSKVYFDGREWLRGKDWTKRKQEVWERGKGRCEQGVDSGARSMNGNIVWEWCRSEMHDPHHIVTRWKKHDDRIENLIGLCRLHHQLAHEKRNLCFGEASRTHKHRLIRSKLGIG